jgi:putative membrane protein
MDMKRVTLLAVTMACSAALSCPAFAADNITAKFVKNAAIGGMFEVQSSKAALTKAQDPKIKNLAQMLIDDHSAANEKLKKIAAKENISVPSQLDTKHQGELDTLRETKGSFAQPFIQMQRKAHEEAITLFKRYADHGDDAALKSFAKNTLPTLEKHRTAIQKIYKDMQGG